MNNLSERINELLNGEKIAKEYFEELKMVAKMGDFNYGVLQWFRYLQTIEITGWRNKKVSEKICKLLLSGEPIKFYSLFCPSYIKGEGEAGFRTDDVGNTTKSGLKSLLAIYQQTLKMGFRCERPKAIFFDIALEQPEKTILMLADLKANIENFKKYVPEGIDFYLLSELFPELKEIVGYQGVIIEPLPVDEKIMRRIVERGKKFYQLFGWSDERILERSKVIASSEATVGAFLRQWNKNSIMVYTPNILERAQVYSGRQQDDPLMIVFPNKTSPNVLAPQ